MIDGSQKKIIFRISVHAAIGTFFLTIGVWSFDDWVDDALTASIAALLCAVGVGFLVAAFLNTTTVLNELYGDRARQTSTTQSAQQVPMPPGAKQGPPTS